MLGPASALTLPASRLREELSAALCELVASVRVFRLTYRRNIGQLTKLTRGVSLHALPAIGEVEPLRPSPRLPAVPIHARLQSALNSPA